ncbi:DUF3419 family protein [Bernardetia sp. OM2101]|uniref:DUF3419 family protein n=1 Tax=Bernardetia sp. OM2101 TaxID=3344876 RepID=UPI0035CE8EB2
MNTTTQKIKQKNDLTQKVDFKVLRYACCWEDADFLLQKLDLEENSNILSIGSAGDNSFSLLTKNPKLLVICDVSEVQLYLIELKKLLIENLNYQEILIFLGYESYQNKKINKQNYEDFRIRKFETLKKELSNPAKIYFETHIDLIKNGIIYQGKFEKYLLLFSQKILPFIHSQSKINELFKPKSQEEQLKFYNQKWNNWRWKLLFKIFFSRFWMGRLGRSPEFLKEVGVNVGKHIFNKTAKELSDTNAQTNFMLRFMLCGDFIGNFENTLPHYLKEESFNKIKQNLLSNSTQIILEKGFAEEIATKYKNQNIEFDAMNLSNIFEYMNEETFIKTSKTLLSATAKEGKLAYWNLMVERISSNHFIEETKNIELKNSSKKDDGFFYDRFCVTQKK